MMKKFQFRTILSSALMVGGFMFTWTITNLHAQTGNQTTGNGNNNSSSSSGNSNNSGSSNSGSGSTGSFFTDFSLESMSFDSAQGTSGFIGGGDAGNFVGASGGTTRNQTSRGASNRSAARTGRTGSTAGGYGATGGNRGNSRTQIQSVYTLGFTPPVRNQEIISSALNSRFAGFSQSTERREYLKTVQITIDNGIVSLAGAVPSEHERKLVENMALLQPGVKKINSQLKIDTAAQSILPNDSNFRLNREAAKPVETISPQQRQILYIF
ncbi:MAG: BON domain-containing protein [Planctomycetaceae bacterium]|jgi:hypothetical protein|nr:BON domain-containing protein [Planctomycetaceae bacterium]